MSEFKFPCPACGQHIQCQAQWSGHQIQCPVCHGELVVPAVPAQAALPRPARPTLTRTASPRPGGKLGVIAGWILIVVTIGLGGWWWATRSWLRPMPKARTMAQETYCRDRLKVLCLALESFNVNGRERLPGATNWCDAILPEISTGMESHFNSQRTYQCPAADSSGRCHFAFNAKLSGLNWEQVDANTVLLFEATGGWNASGGPELLPAKPRHPGKYLVLFAGGQVTELTPAQLKTLRWDP